MTVEDKYLKLNTEVYGVEKGSLVGLNGLIDSEIGNSTNVLACFDNEEVGSGTKQGAASPMLRTVVERITIAMNKDKEDYYRALSNSFLISAAVYEGICKSIDIPVQKFTNRSDARGGSTIGPISSSQLDISSVDIGNPILGMHSIRELGGVFDHYYVYESFREFYKMK